MNYSRVFVVFVTGLPVRKVLEKIPEANIAGPYGFGYSMKQLYGVQYAQLWTKKGTKAMEMTQL